MIWEKELSMLHNQLKNYLLKTKAWELDKTGFKRVSDNKLVDIIQLPNDNKSLYYKGEPYTPKELHQRLIITYSPKYAKYQKTIREKASGTGSKNAYFQKCKKGT